MVKLCLTMRGRHQDGVAHLGGLIVLGLLQSVFAGCTTTADKASAHDSEASSPLVAIYAYRQEVICRAAIWPDGGVLFTDSLAEPGQPGLRYVEVEQDAIAAIRRALAVARDTVRARDRTLAWDVEGAHSLVIWLGDRSETVRLEWDESYWPGHLAGFDSVGSFAEFAGAWARIRMAVESVVVRLEGREPDLGIPQDRRAWEHERAWQHSR